jgi:hypothetical protein
MNKLTGIYLHEKIVYDILLLFGIICGVALRSVFAVAKKFCTLRLVP